MLVAVLFCESDGQVLMEVLFCELDGGEIDGRVLGGMQFRVLVEVLFGACAV